MARAVRHLKDVKRIQIGEEEDTNTPFPEDSTGKTAYTDTHFQQSYHDTKLLHKNL